MDIVNHVLMHVALFIILFAGVAAVMVVMTTRPVRIREERFDIPDIDLDKRKEVR